MHIQFAELPVSDQDRARAFYVTHFDCQVVADAPMGAADRWRWIELKFPGSQTALHFLRARENRDPDEPVLVLIDGNLHDTVGRLRAAGVEIITEPQEAPWQPGRTVAEFRDSEGNRMVLGTPEASR